jgi:uncharacterized protein YcbX
MEGSGSLSLARIRVYPLKGAAGVDLEEGDLDAFGIAGDRRWMLVTLKGDFISQRTHSRLCLIRVERDQGAAGGGTTFTVTAPGMDAIVLAPFQANGEGLEVRVHKDRLFSPTGDGETDRWFSFFLGEPCRLVYMPEALLRPVDPEFAEGHRVSFADGYPLHVTTEESLQALNRKLHSPMSMLRFRPNLVLRGGIPWEEDHWRLLEVGTATVEIVKACARCAVTAVDPETGTRGGEPLKTLRSFREWNGKVYFGQNAVLQNGGRLRIGDRVRVLSLGDPGPLSL